MPSATRFSAKRLPFFYGWVVIAVTFVTMGIGVNARTAFSLLFSPLIDEFGWQRGLTAGAFSFGFVVSAVLSPMVGRVMDRSGPRAVMELGVVMMAAGLMLAPLITQPWHLYLTIGFLVGGGSVCIGYSGQSLYLPNWFVRRRGLAVSLAFTGVGIGSITLLPWFQNLIERSGWRAACWTLGVVVLVALVPINLLLRKKPEDLGLHPDGDDAPTAGAVRAQNIVDPAWVAIDWTLSRAVKTARFWWLAVGYFCALYIWYAVQIHQTKYLEEIGFSSTSAAWALGLVSFAAIPGQVALGYLSDRIGREWVWAIGNLGFAICYLALILLQDLPSLWLLYVMVIAQGLLGYGLTSVMGALAMEIFQGAHFGAIYGTLTVYILAGGAVGPWITGALHDVTGNYTLAFAIAIALAAISTLAMWLAAPRKVRVVAGRIRHLAE